MQPYSLLTLSLCALLNCSALHAQQLAGDKFKNVTVLKDMPADQMGKVMNIMSQSLGVNCQHCHAGTDFAQEHAGEKDAAREMIQMTLTLNRQAFQGREQITCYTCHRGRAQPDNQLPVDTLPSLPMAAAVQPDAKPTVADILEKHSAAIGGRAKLSAIDSLTITGKRVEPNGRSEAEEQRWQRGGSSRLVTLYGQLPITELVEGTKVQKLVGERVVELKQDEARQILIDSRLLLAEDLTKLFGAFQYEQQIALGDKQVNVLQRTRSETSKAEVEQFAADGPITDKLMFDVASGLLVRRVASLPTVLGRYDYQVDYEDYLAINGVMIPRTLRFSTPNIRWTRVIEKIVVN